MADEKDLKNQLEKMAKEIERVNKALQTTERTVSSFEKAIDGATNNAVDKAVVELKALIKTTGLMNDQEARKVKSARELVSFLNKLKERTGDVTDALNAHHEVVEAESKAVAAGTKTVKESNKTVAQSKKQLGEALKAAGVDIEAAGGNFEEAAKQFLKISQQVGAEVNKQTKELGSAINRVKKELDTYHKSLISKFEEMGRVGFVFEELKSATTALYTTFSKFSDKGMLGAFGTIVVASKSLKLTTDQMFRLVQANKQLVIRFGAGAEGINKFTKALEKAQDELPHLSSDEAANTFAKIMGTLDRAGFGPTAKDVQLQKIYNTNMKRMTDQFKFLQSAFGDTAEEFSEFYSQMYASESIQRRLLAGDTKNLDLILKETMARTENLRVIGLSNQQILELNRKLEAVYDPAKNQQSELIKQQIQARNWLSLAQRDTGIDEKTRGKLADPKTKKAYSDYMAYVTSGDTLGAQNFLASTPEGMELSSLISSARQQQLNTKVEDAKKHGGISYKGIVQNQMFDQGGLGLSVLKEQGDAYNRYLASGGPAFNTADFDSYKQRIKEQATGKEGEASEKLVKSFEALRSTVNSLNAFLKDELLDTFKHLGLAALGVISLFSILGKAKGILFPKSGRGIGTPPTVPEGGAGKGGGKPAPGGKGGAGGGAKTGGAGKGGMGGAGGLALLGLAADGILGIAGWNSDYSKLQQKYVKKELTDDEFIKAYVALGLEYERGDTPSLTESAKAAIAGIKQRSASGTIGTGDMSALIPPVTQPPKVAQPSRSAAGKVGSGSTSSGRTAVGRIGGGAVSGEGPAMDNLLDFIGEHESRGSYNALVGGGETDLEHMTLAQVYAMQDRMIESGRASTAVGKYQTIRKTLQGAAAALGMDPNTTLFNKATQDKIGAYLVHGRIDRANNTVDAISNLSKEWASLPKDSFGHGSYDGFNGNKARAPFTTFHRLAKDLVMPQVTMPINSASTTLQPPQASALTEQEQKAIDKANDDTTSSPFEMNLTKTNDILEGQTRAIVNAIEKLNQGASIGRPSRAVYQVDQATALASS